ncbi:rRNA processing protein [Niveomyces insectorum RCEF 264]|uniref:Ribosomal RNA-processing protein 8 n=1 Tax=Niveomyces insectorum RCEF 264 TaxID=1081102 RepID=A0A167SEM4_9HYPO|nr:rRNA processing protein [Niveomyces insectorum RCEF 264]
MFAVPGWSLSADKLKSETPNGPAPPPPAAPSPASGANATMKKRKRPAAPSGPRITADNVVDMWERVIEKKGRGGPKGPKGQKSQKAFQAVQKSRPNNDKEDTEREERAPEQAASAAPFHKGDRTDREPAPKKAKRSQQAEGGGDEDTAPALAEPQPASTHLKSAAKRTDTETVVKPAAKTAQPSPRAGEKRKDTPVTKREQAAATTAVPIEILQQDGDQKIKKSRKEREREKKEKKRAASEAKSASTNDGGDGDDSATFTVAAAPVSALAPPAASAGPALTPLQAAMRAKLVAARFRHLNETLYTNPSAEARRLFADSPDMFLAYHEGFRQQVAVWPENPVDGYIAEVQRRGAIGSGAARSGKFNGRGGGGRVQKQHNNPGDLPRTGGTCHIADVGCGDARLAAALAPVASRLRVAVHSYDLHADPANQYLTAAADAADLPLADGSVDVVVFCLALMGTNWPAFVEEAYRVLRWKGELWVAEIKSRFAGAAELKARQKLLLGDGRKPGGPVAHSVGKGANPDEADPDVTAAATAEVDGLADDDKSRGATDVSAFVRALRRRGFVLDQTDDQGDGGGGDGGGGDGGEHTANAKTTGRGKPPAVDLRNKMFVTLRFLKGAPAEVGKGVVPGAAAGAPGGKNFKPRFSDGNNGNGATADPMDDPALEAKILKPCLYKQR